ncbi:type II secretion system protein [Sulfurisoma sediminicola]|uniref:Prepilin-type N-terminal cleavage/methylation domain-containing protein n=1 Tax=Sulfurisoma sediminicola TaxID=1381557 RepID=A0A497XCQ7_9PROT|nr:prepilin-type N-terminal cleavage/methylation domain-containing protein [Sulfurisoma sediminicola]RLJ63752.1 prepilin-type N-terminal cleavage/methylation domain-containing protein [Sulfurisoma sediminicola]
MTPRALSSQDGFTLMELTVVLVIVALLIGGLMVPLSTQQDIKGRQDTEKALSEIREALIGFAVVNGRLPCPATATIPSGTAGAGVEVTTGSGSTLACTSAGGILPWATLGVPETDAWGNRYTYRVTLNFARGIPQTTFGCTPASDPVNAAFALCTPGDISVLTKASGGAIVSSAVPAVVVSHGKLASGAYTSSGSLISGAAGDEAENADADATFVSSFAIDDQVIWLSPNLLMNRMIAAGKLP